MTTLIDLPIPVAGRVLHSDIVTVELELAPFADPSSRAVTGSQGVPTTVKKSGRSTV